MLKYLPDPSWEQLEPDCFLNARVWETNAKLTRSVLNKYYMLISRQQI